MTGFQRRSRAVLTRLYWAGVEAGFWEDCDAYRQTFVACCVATMRVAKTSPMGLLQGFVQANLRDRSGETEEERKKFRLSVEDDEEARRIRRVWNTPPEYLEAQRMRRVEYEAAPP